MTLKHILTVALAAVVPAALPASAQEIAAPFQQYIEGLEAGDPALASEAFAEDAVVIAGNHCPTKTPCIGRDNIRKLFIEPVVAVHIKHRLDESVPLRLGDMMLIRVEVRSDSLASRSIERIVGVDLVKLSGDKIAELSFFADPNDEQTAKFLAALSAQN